MKICTLIVASALSVSAVLASQLRFRGALPRTHRRGLASTSDAFPSGLKSVPNDDAYHMEPVSVVHARVEASAPVWDSDHGMFVPSVGTTFEERFRAGLDTVNTVSVEGALMYVQTEGINYATRGDDAKCTRTNGMKYVVLYEMVVAQTNETLAEYGAASEYGPYLALNDGQCAPTGTTDANGDPVFPKECYAIDGTDDEPSLGAFVGAKQRDTDTSAPYTNVWQYSFSNTCPLEKWGNKTDACRAKSRVAGLCEYDTKPDGVTCTYNYRVLGWVPLDDLVGITHLKEADTEATYADFAAFCAAGGVEFNASPDGEWVDGLDFWKTPVSDSANAARVAKLVALYNDAVKGDAVLSQVSADDLANFKPLPSASDLASANPPCYKNVKNCATAEFGCRRKLLGQVCATCYAEASECVVAPEGFNFPTLKVAKVTTLSEPEPATEDPATPEPTTAEPETPTPTTSEPETPAPTTAEPETPAPSTAEPKTPAPTPAEPETSAPTTAEPETQAPISPKTPEPTTEEPATPAPTTEEPVTPAPTTEAPKTPEPTTAEPETLAPTTTVPKTPEPTTEEPTTPTPNTEKPNTPEPTTEEPEPTTEKPNAPEPTTEEPETPVATTEEPKTPEPTSEVTPKPTSDETLEPMTENPTTENPDATFAPAEVPTETTTTPPATTATATPTSAPTATMTAPPASNTTSSKSEKESTAPQRVVVTVVALAMSLVASCLLA